MFCSIDQMQHSYYRNDERDAEANYMLLCLTNTPTLIDISIYDARGSKVEINVLLQAKYNRQ